MFGLAIPFMLALLVGVFLIVQGVRGIPALSDPKCAKCQYDLRWIKPDENKICPECGSDLTAPRAVRFGEFRRRPRVIAIGCILIALAFAGPLLLNLIVAPRMGPVPTSSTPTTTILARLPGTAGQPWDWQELERRLTSGKLSKADTTTAVETLITWLKGKPNPGQEPLHWVDGFLAAADAAGRIPSEQFTRLAQAFYGPQAEVKLRGKLVKGEPLPFEVRYAGPWNLRGLKLARALHRVTLHGKELLIHQRHEPKKLMGPDELSQAGPFPIEGILALDAPTGKHTLQFDVDLGLVSEATPFKTETDRPGQRNRWPKTRATWTSTVTVPITILDTGASVIELVTSDDQNPLRKGRLSAKATLYSRSDKKSTLKLGLDSVDLSIPIAATVTLHADGREIARIPYGICIDAHTGEMTQDFGGLAIDRLSPAITKIDLILAPSKEAAESSSMFERIWGKTITLKDVPLVREDLDDATTAGEASRPSE